MRQALKLLLHTLGLVKETTVNLEESLEDIKEDSVLDPQERDLYGMGIPTMDVWS